MTTNAEEESNQPEMLEIVSLDGLVGWALEYQSKGRGFESKFESKFSNWRNSHLWILYFFTVRKSEDIQY